MIEIQDKEIVFTPPEGLFDSKHPVVRRELEFGFQCPVCKYPVLAAYEEPTEHSLHPGTYTPGSATQILYHVKNFRLVNGKRGQMLLESKHFYNMQSSADYWGACKLNMGVINFQPGDRYAATRLFYLMQKLYNSSQFHVKVLELLNKYDKGPQFFLEAVQPTVTRVEDVCGRLPALFLLNRNAWNYGTVPDVYHKIKAAQNKDEALKEEEPKVEPVIEAEFASSEQTDGQVLDLPVEDEVEDDTEFDDEEEYFEDDEEEYEDLDDEF